MTLIILDFLHSHTLFRSTRYRYISTRKPTHCHASTTTIRQLPLDFHSRRRGSECNHHKPQKRPTRLPPGGVLRKVTWSHRCLVRVIPRIADMSEEEITLAYYTKEDTKRIQEDIAETAFLMKHGAAESDDITFRGLERKRAGEARRRRLHRMMVCRAVMAAAAEIQACGDKDEEHDEAIGQTCRLLTVSCTVAALERAAHDAREVNQSPLPTPSYGFSPSYEEETLAVPLALSSMVPVAVVCKGSH